MLIVVHFITDTTNLFPSYPGHNFAIVTNRYGKIEAEISKRPGTERLGSYNQIADPRFHFQNGKIHSYAAKFTSFFEELKTWEEKNSSRLKNEFYEYPIFFQIFPFLDPEDAIKKFKQNVEEIRRLRFPYTLLSYRHPHDGSYIRPKNCNDAVNEAIFGNGALPLETSRQCDFSTQKAAITIGLRLTECCPKYLKQLEQNGLHEIGMKEAEFNEDLYGFTCGVV